MTAAAKCGNRIRLMGVLAWGKPSTQIESEVLAMKKEEVLIGATGILVGILGGYFLTNWYNESIVGEISPTGGQVSSAVAATQTSLSADEIRQLIKRADDAPQNLVFQKEVGISLYRYGASVEDSAIVTEAIRLLERVYDSNPTDRETLVSLGNSHFDIGYFKKDNQSFEKARKYYNEALEIQTADPDVRVDLGLTFALQNPPAFDKAIAEYEVALRTAPNHQRTLQMMTDALLTTGRKTDAATFLDRLKAANPTHPMISDFDRRVSTP